MNTAIAGVLTAIGFGNGFRSIFIFSQCIGLTINFFSLIAVPLYKKAERTSVQLGIIIASIVAGGIVGTMLGALGNGIDPFVFLREHSTLFFQVVLLALLFGFIVSYVFISVQLISEEKLRRLEAEKATMQTELKMLQSQVEPHFLFNTLANVLSLIETDRARASRMLESFTSFLRSSLLTARQESVPLSQEMDLVRNYLAVFDVRMGDRLKYRIELPDHLRDFRVPPLLVQPLVENAIKHGLEPLAEGGEIVILASQEGALVRISVADNGLGIVEQASGTSIGLENIRKRLELIYGESAGLIIEENVPKGIRVVIEIPYEAN